MAGHMILSSPNRGRWQARLQIWGLCEIYKYDLEAFEYDYQIFVHAAAAEEGIQSKHAEEEQWVFWAKEYTNKQWPSARSELNCLLPLSCNFLNLGDKY